MIHSASFINIAQERNIVQTAIEDGRFHILVLTLRVADLVEALSGPGPFTVFAPTDAAFEKLPPEVLRELLRPESHRRLVELLTYHVVGGKALTAAEILAMNPPFKLKMLNNLTTEITVNAGKVEINNSTVTQADVRCTNGIIHVIDTVIFPPNIVQTAINDGRFKTLVTALTAAGLVEPLSRAGPFTVFAPTDAAFAKLPPGTLDNLLKPENRPELIRILTYHVVANRELTSADILALNPPFRLEMLNGLSTEVTVAGGMIKVNSATVIVANVFASNGIVHAIDTVLLPAN